MHVRHPLFLLTLAVAAAHALLLAEVTSPGLRLAPPVAPQAFSTRTVAAQVAPAPAPTAASVGTQQRAAQPAPVRSAAKRQVRPKRPVPPARAVKPAAQHDTAQSADTTPAAALVGQAPSAAELLAMEAFDQPIAPTPAPAPSATNVASADDATGLLAPTSVPEAGSALPAVAENADPAAPAVGPTSAAALGTEPSATSPAAPAATPVPIQLPPSRRLGFTVTGKAKGFSYSAMAELLWEHDSTSYRAQQELKVLFLGSRSQTSVGSITEWGLQPRRFGDRARTERAAHFDFAAGRVTFSANSPAVAIAPGAQDRLSVFLQLASMMAGAPDRYPTGTEIAMNTISARSADVWTFTVQAEQTLELPAGSMAAIPLERLPRREYDQKAQVWLAPSLGYLPVRIRLTEANGDFAELNLRSEEAP